MTKDNIIPMPDTDRIEEEASMWVIRLAEGGITPSDAELVSWLGQGPQHRDAFQRLSQFWGGLDFAEGLNDYAESDVAKTSLRQERMAQRFRVLRPVLSTAVAASVLLIVGWFAIVDQVGQGDSYQGQYQTAIGEQETVELPDGSRIILNTDSLMEVAFSEDARRITLSKGEAYFDVAPDPTKPFSVQTEKGSVTAVGTAFSVRLVAKKLNVVVTEGRVALKTGPQSRVDGSQDGPSREGLVTGDANAKASLVGALGMTEMEVSAGQAAVVDQGIEDISIVQPHALEKALDWQDGELSFRGETLEQVIEEIGRYTDIRIEIGDEQLREQKIVAYYKMGDVERIFEAFNVMANIDVERISDNHVKLYRSK